MIKPSTMMGMVIILLLCSCHPRFAENPGKDAHTSTFEISPAVKIPTHTAVVIPNKSVDLSTQSIVDLPPVLFIQPDSLQIVRTSDPEWIPTDLITKDRVYDAIRFENWVYILSMAGFQRVDLTTGSVEMLLPLEQEFLFTGHLATTKNQPYVIVSFSKSEPPDRKGELYLYDIKSKSIAHLLTQLPFPYPLGLTSHAVYFYNIHGDPPFTTIESINIRDREVQSIEIGNSWAYAALSPDGKYIVAQGYQDPTELGQPLIKGLRLIELGNEQEKDWIDLPNLPSEVTGFLWSPDSQSVYFYLQRAPNDHFEAGLGVWELDVETRTVRQVSNLQVPWGAVKTFANDCCSILIASDEGVYALNVESGQVAKLSIITTLDYIIRNQ